MNDILTLDSYTKHLNGLGIYDAIDIQLQYKIYLATQTEDQEVISKSMISYYYNTYYRLLGRFN